MSGDELAGSVVYEVRAEVQPLLQGGNQVNKILSEIESSLDANIAQFKKMDTQVSATAQGVNQSVRSFGGFQNALRQSGYQIQDFIVQVQGGQSALVALSQQGSQLLGVFGTGGAVAGALLTLGTVIVGSLIAGMDNASVSTKALTDSQKRLADIFQITANGVVVLSDKFAKLAETSENAARAQLTIALIDAQNIIKSSVQSVNDLGDALGTWKAPLSAAISQLDALKARGSDVNSILKELGGTYEGNIIGLNQLNQVVGEISTAFGISANDAVKLVQALADVRHNANPDTIAALRDVTVDLSQKYGYANKSLSEFTGKVGEYSLKADQAAESTRLATEMLQGHKVASEADTEAIAQNTQRLQTYIQMIKDEGATIAMTARQRALYRAEQLGATEEDKKAINSSFDKIDAFKAEQQAQKTAAKESRRSASQSASEAKKLASQQDSIAQKLEQLRQKAMLAADSSQELSREQSILSAQQSLGKGATQEQIALAGKYAAQAYDVAAAIKAQQKAEKEKQDTESAYAQVRQAASPVVAVDDQFQKQMASLNAYATLYPQKIAEVEATRAQIEEQYRQKRQEAMWQELSQQSLGYNMLTSAVDAFSGNASNAITGLLTGTMSAQEAMRSLGNTILNSVINSIVQVGVEALKNYILGQTLGAASVATSVGLAATTASAWAPAAAMASLASFGANAGPAAAGISSTVGLASGLALAGARYNGGPVSAGGLYQVGEKGKPEIYQASTGKQYMIPGDNGKVISNKDMNGGQVQVNIQFYDQTSGGQHSFQALASQEGGVVTVEAFLTDVDRNGPMASAIQSAYGLGRKAQGAY
ncbi:TPA: phage tail length tape measure family protein [Klebsiella pneumoniae]|uniref:phage tail length tape measure family protein n=1 Tax=Klebsiella pneumoniae complex TaxID=3390273 RepID=UPI0010352BC6|nr:MULTISPECIES: phage tail length tape measure family protein [Klebsiella]MDK1765268.1 phage tail length tape measure family protein [Klebsiella pneumoniae]MEE4426438.1 phage tail length tape measure family protein [Klebsiella pneumoniae]HCA8418719.1 phage tail length tape measure family protein [Klebsiella pneumoniae]HCA8423201.1 phage tail length tape measure family protein [Klebsiella pneumoniae]HCA8434871.1 phage tail length tape measure family protein [Klebsiella pneumoniae]